MHRSSECQVPHHNCINKRHPEYEPSCSKHVEDIKIKISNINFENVRFIRLYCIIKRQYRVQNHKISRISLFSYSNMNFQIIDCFSSIELVFKRRIRGQKTCILFEFTKDAYRRYTHVWSINYEFAKDKLLG